MIDAQQRTQTAPRPMNLFFLVAALLPLLGYVGSIGLAEAQRWGAPTIEVAIEGFDPRDLVRGHYLNYQVALGPNDHSQGASFQGDRYSFEHACATRPEGGVSPVLLFNGDAPAACETALSVDFVRATHRFYVQQDQALELERAVRDKRATVSLRVINTTQLTADQLLVDGKTVSSR